MNKKKIYRVIFHNQDKVFEVYAKGVSHGDLFGFIGVDQLIFGEKSALVVDPSEETLKTEFSNVSRTYIPLHAIIRIDEVDKQGLARVMPGTVHTGNVAPFPVYTKGDNRKK